jgi:hypothetical protein
MRVDVNGTTLWFDVDGPALVPDGRRMSERADDPQGPIVTPVSHGYVRPAARSWFAMT